jgi:undecaprenyl-phosphate 4-deoxy-4-formamido-L-arabinose transferase
MPALSFVIPLYNSESTIAGLVRAIASLEVAGGHEIVLVNDGSRDRTSEICCELARKSTRVPIVVAEHSRNFGEHNAVLTGWRLARGAHIVNLDDDGQNPPGEAVRLWEHAKATGVDVVFGHYSVKQHSPWRNLGSWFTNRMTDWALEKPAGFYLSSFRCVTAFVAREVAKNSGPAPYIDGLILQVTQRIASLQVLHAPRMSGRSGYTLRRLVRLWLSAWVNFSVLPLRVATVLGLAMAAAGMLGIAIVLWLRVTEQGPAFGWGSLMAALLVFSGTQLVMLGMIGEYVGRMFLAINQRPQAVVRDVVRGGFETEGSMPSGGAISGVYLGSESQRSRGA